MTQHEDKVIYETCYVYVVKHIDVIFISMTLTLCSVLFLLLLADSVKKLARPYSFMKRRDRML